MPAATIDPSTSAASVRELYLDLLKRSLMNSIYQDAEYQSISVGHGWRPMLGALLRRAGLDLVKKADPTLRAQGRDWPLSAHTMIGETRLNNLQHCMEEIIRRNVPGDVIETGVWRGGASIFMRGVLKAYGIKDRTIYVADSFEGLPKPTHEIDRQDPGNDFYKDRQLAVSLEQVRKNFQAYGLLDEQVRFIKGWFRDTLASVAATQFAVIRLDGDLYESTMDGLVNLYPKLSSGGFLIVDDYNIPACRQAVADYRRKHNITDPIEPIDWAGVFWKRS